MSGVCQQRENPWPLFLSNLPRSEEEDDATYSALRKLAEEGELVGRGDLGGALAGEEGANNTQSAGRKPRIVGNTAKEEQ